MFRLALTPAFLLAAGLATALSGGFSGAVHAEGAGITGPALDNQSETAIAFAWLTAGSPWPETGALLENDEMLAPGAQLALDLPGRARGDAALRLITADGFITDVVAITLRDLKSIRYEGGRISLIYDDGSDEVPVQSSRYTGAIDCLDEDGKDADCLDRRSGQIRDLGWPGAASAWSPYWTHSLGR